MSSDESLSVHQKETIRLALVETARKYIGVPYKYGAEWTDYTKPPEALDCSEFVEGVYHLNGLKMPDGAQSQYNFTVHTPTPQMGDLAFFGKGGDINQIYHVGIVLNDTAIIEARGFDPKSSFETGKVIVRPRSRWEAYLPSFVGYRSHSKLL